MVNRRVQATLSSAPDPWRYAQKNIDIRHTLS
jgi:hypothetical protein